MREKRFRISPQGGAEIVGRWQRLEDCRDGPTVVYLHGFGSSQDGEKAEFFRHRVVGMGLEFCSFDFRGHGVSAGSMLDLTLSRCLADVAAVLGYLGREGVTRFAFLGSSMGGLVGLWYSARDPTGVEGGLYVAPAIGMAESLEILVGKDGLRSWREEGSIEVTSELGTYDLGWGLVEDLAEYPTAMLVDRYRAQRVPAVIFQGRRDDRVLWREVVAFARATPEVTKLRLFEAGNHRLLEYKEQIWTGMKGFLET